MVAGAGTLIQVERPASGLEDFDLVQRLRNIYQMASQAKGNIDRKSVV